MKVNKELFAAIDADDVREVRRLLAEDPRRANLRDPGGSPPLSHAASQGCDARIVEALLEAGADAAFEDADGYNALHCAMIGRSFGDEETTTRVFRALVERGASLERVTRSYGWTPLAAAVMEGRDEDVKALIAVGARVDVTFPAHALPAFTRGRSLKELAKAWPSKVAILETASREGPRDVSQPGRARKRRPS